MATRKAAPESRAKRATPPSPTPPAAPATRTTYLLRTCAADMTSYGGFKWPKSGPVSAPDWKPRQSCGNGLHGLLHGDGDASLMSWDEKAKWLVVAVDAAAVVQLDGKVKVPGGEVVFCGERGAAITKLLELDPEASPSRVPCGQASASGYQGQASASGQRGQASASGDYGQASASGQRGQASASGDYGQASASGDYGQASASGYQGQASASGDYGQASASGDYGQASAYRGRARAGQLGILILFRWDDAAQRDRVVTGYVGENGIQADKWYKLNAAGEIVESPDTDYDYTSFEATIFECAAEAKALKDKKSSTATVAA